jgi:hypothetical protein
MNDEKWTIHALVLKWYQTKIGVEMWWKVFQFQISKFVNFFRKPGILILCHNLPHYKMFLHFDKKIAPKK